MSKRASDDAFKKMAVELSYAHGVVKEVPQELGIDHSRLSKWSNRANSPKQVLLRSSKICSCLTS